MTFIRKVIGITAKTGQVTIEIVAPCEHVELKTHFGVICRRCGKTLTESDYLLGMVEK